MQSPTLAFIGAGHIANSLISGLIASGYAPNKIWASNPSATKLTALQEKFGIQTTLNNVEAARAADVVILTVKPQIAKKVISELASIINKQKPLLISPIAMMTVTQLKKWLGIELPIVRCMPNIGARFCCSATTLYADAAVHSDQKNIAQSILAAVGLVAWVETEEQLDIATILAGSGTAYFLLLMDILAKSAEKLGLPLDQARLLVAETALGAARLALASTQTPGELTQQVASKGGPTECALAILTQGGITKLFDDAMTAAYQRIITFQQENS